MGMLMNRHERSRSAPQAEPHKPEAPPEPKPASTAIETAARDLVELDGSADEAAVIDRLAQVKASFAALTEKQQASAKLAEEADASRAKAQENADHAAESMAELAKLAADARDALAKAEAERDAARAQAAALQKTLDELTAPSPNSSDAAQAAEEKPSKGSKK